MYGAWAVGGLVASTSLPRLLRGTTAARVTLVALPWSAALGLLTPLWTTWWVGGLSLLAWSAVYTLVAVNSISYRQQVSPEALLGRVNIAGRMLARGLGWSGGAILAGALSNITGLRAALVTMALVPLIGVAVAWTSPSRKASRTVDDLSEVA